MKDYGRIITKIGSTPWLMTSDGLGMMLSIVDRHLTGDKISDDELMAIKLEATERRGGSGSRARQGGIGILPIHGPIFGKANMMTEMSGASSLEQLRSEFNAMMESSQIDSIVLDIDSPGGTSDLVSEFGSDIRAARDEKPIYAIANTHAGSAAYWLGAQANKLYVTPSGMVGSIGAFAVHTDQSGADIQKGLKYTFTSAGPYKTEGNPHEPLTAEAAAYRQEVIDELYTNFVDAVAEGRQTTTEDVRINFGGGRMITPDKALKSGMVDGVLTFDNLIGTIQNQPQKVSVAVGGGHSVSASMIDGMLDMNEIVQKMESKEWEHSEPGTGSPPAPRKDQDGSDDKAIKNGWRRDIPPEDDRSISPSPPPVNTNLNANEGGETTMPELTLEEQLATILGISDPEAIVKMVTDMSEESKALKTAVHANTEEGRLASEFPAFWNQHQDRISKERVRDASEFAKNVTMFTKQEGDKQIETGFGLSALAIDEVEGFHLKFAEGKASLADFESMINSIAHGGTLDYRESGTERSRVIPNVLDTSTPVGLSNARQQFAALVSEVQEEHKDDKEFTYAMAVTEAAEKNPDIAAAYRQASPGNS